MREESSLREDFAASIQPKFMTMRSATKKTFRGTVMKVVTDFLLAFQCAIMAFVYAALAYFFPIFWYVSLGLTFLACIYILISDKDGLSKSSWIFLMIVSCGCGYIILFLADRRICCRTDKKIHDKIYARCRLYTPAYAAPDASKAVVNDCEYLYKAGGFIPYKNTKLRYFDMGAPLFNDMLSKMDEAEDFIFLEFFTLADGALLERMISILKRKAASGVRVLIIYDSAGCQGVLAHGTVKRIKEAGIEIREFQPMLSLFSFGLNIRDHRKIAVIDGKTGYAGGCNVADKYMNLHRLQAVWKDAGVRLEGEAVDGLTEMFLRQWEFVSGEKVDYARYTGLYERFENCSTVVPYAGGADISASVCRDVYMNLISAADKKLYIMTPYFIPGLEIYQLIKNKALSGVDVRLILPSVPDWKYIYMVSKLNAEGLVESGVKVYYARATFVHSKVALTENAAIVGSVNMDMRAFNMQYDNAIYTDDATLMQDVERDFESVFSNNDCSDGKQVGPFHKAVATCLKVVSPLM